MKKITVKNSKQSIREVKVGENVVFYDFVNVYECTIGDNTKIGSFVEIQKNVTVGKKCKISSHTFICSGVTIEDEVFIGHNVTFINDKYPKATNKNGSMQNEKNWTVVNTLIKKGASIGSSVTIMCGIVIGENAMIGAGSVVTKNIPPNAIAFGNPARIIKRKK